MTRNTGTKVKLSVVIAASNDISSLYDCLESLKGQISPMDTEVIVASNLSNEPQESIERRFPYAKYVSLPSDTTVPELCTTGIRYAQGEIVALSEDHCVFHPQWCSELMKAHESPYDIIGGCVENHGSSRLLDWAVYFYDYGKYMPPERAQVVDDLPGNNVSYKRTALDEIRNSYEKGFFETFINLELKKRGYSLFLTPCAVVSHKNHYQMKDIMICFYHHGRSFAGIRTRNASLLKRFGFTLGSLVLPVLQIIRILFRTVRKKRYVWKLLLCTPWLTILIASWSFGELRGYLGGEGLSSRQWT